MKQWTDAEAAAFLGLDAKGLDTVALAAPSLVVHTAEGRRWTVWALRSWAHAVGEVAARFAPDAPIRLSGFTFGPRRP